MPRFLQKIYKLERRESSRAIYAKEGKTKPAFLCKVATEGRAVYTVLEQKIKFLVLDWFIRYNGRKVTIISVHFQVGFTGIMNVMITGKKKADSHFYL